MKARVETKAARGGGPIDRGAPRKLQLPGAEGPITDIGDNVLPGIESSDVLEREENANRAAKREPVKPEPISMADNEDEMLKKESA